MASSWFVSFQYLSYISAHTHISANLNSPFLPELGGPGGLSVTDPLKREQNVYSTFEMQYSNHLTLGEQVKYV